MGPSWSLQVIRGGKKETATGTIELAKREEGKGRGKKFGEKKIRDAIPSQIDEEREEEANRYPTKKKG